jgi:hypothetical protein
MVRGQDNNLGGTGLTRKEGGRKAASKQNQFGGGRYGIGEEVRNGTQRAISKRKQATPVTINPDRDMVAQTFN